MRPAFRCGILRHALLLRGQAAVVAQIGDELLQQAIPQFDMATQVGRADAAGDDHVHFHHQELALLRQAAEAPAEIPALGQPGGQFALHAQGAAEGEVEVARRRRRRIAEAHRVADSLAGTEQLHDAVLLAAVDPIAGLLQGLGQAVDGKVFDQGDVVHVRVPGLLSDFTGRAPPGGSRPESCRDRRRASAPSLRISPAHRWRTVGGSSSPRRR